MTDLHVLAVEHLAAAEEIDGSMFGGGHEPGARLLRDTGLRPTLQRGEQRVLGQVLRQSYILDHAGEAGDELGRLHSPDSVYGSMSLGSRHGYQSDVLTSRLQVS
jgi:hypothetical protein